MPVAIHWFRHGLRLHDNPALLESVQPGTTLYPVFIFDGKSAGTELCGYIRWRFLLESLADLDQQFQKFGGRLFVMRGTVENVLPNLIQEWGVNKVTFEQDPEPIWQARDQKAREICADLGVECVERVSHTLWDPSAIIEENGGTPPLTRETFVAISSLLGDPVRPAGDPDFSKVNFCLPNDFSRFQLPTLEDLGIEPEVPEQVTPYNRWIGGETAALKIYEDRVDLEISAFKRGIVLPNHLEINLLAQPTSLSPYLRYGCLSVRKFYWAIQDAHLEVGDKSLDTRDIVTQLIWREYFYTMSVNNPKFDLMDDNDICLNIDWYSNTDHLKRWTQGKTGYPWIDAIMRQIVQEGWTHHVGRTAVAGFLTRGDLWISWEEGAKMFFQYQIDADWSVCAGNWMWVSSSAFERLLDFSECLCPIRTGKALDNSGEFIKRYVPELKDLPLRYVFEPWRAPASVQEAAGCIVGKDYPTRIVDHKSAVKENVAKMDAIRRRLKSLDIRKMYCSPSNSKEAEIFVWKSEIENLE